MFPDCEYTELKQNKTKWSLFSVLARPFIVWLQISEN